MKRLIEIWHHLRAINACEMKHKKAMRHANHAFHSAYLGWYVIDWHLPMSVIVLPLFVLTLASWLLHLELE